MYSSTRILQNKCQQTKDPEAQKSWIQCIIHGRNVGASRAHQCPPPFHPPI